MVAGRPRLGLRTKLFLAFLLALLPILGLLLLDYIDDYRQQERVILAGQLRTAQAVAAVVEEELDAAIQVSLALSRDPVIRGLETDQLAPHLAGYLPLFPEYESINVWNPQGDSVAAAIGPTAESARANISDREHFRQAMSSGRPAISGVITARIGGFPTVAVGVPLKGDDGSTGGVLTTVLNLGVLADSLRQVQMDPAQQLFVVDQKGIPAVYGREPASLPEARPLANYPPVRAAAEAGQFVGTVEKGLSEEASLVAASRTPKYGWVAGVSTPVSVALAPVQQALATKLAIYGFAALLALVLAVALAVTITRPLEEMNRTIAAIGAGDLGRRVKIRTGDELEDTASAFNRMAEELQREQESLRAILETVPVGVVVMEAPSGRLMVINRMAKDLLGVDMSQPRVQSVADWSRLTQAFRADGSPLPPEDTPLGRALVRGETVLAEEMVIKLPEGGVTLLVHAAPMAGPDGGTVAAVAAFQDVTRLKEIQRQLEEMGRTREDFISMVAHDLRSPLTVIQGFAGFLRTADPTRTGEPLYSRAVENILASGKRLERMTADLLDASRIEAHHLTIYAEPLRLDRLIPEVVERNASIYAGHPLQVEIDPGLPVVNADPSRLEQLLGNLLSNAAKYSFPESEIVVGARRHPDGAVVSVSNQGPGIAADQLDAVFGRFHRTERAAQSREPGLGLGLYISRGLVEAHGGRMWAESEPGKTTTFSFTLPVTPLGED